MDISEIRKIIADYEPQIYGSHREFAVLLPLVKVSGDWHVLYEVRSKKISQPGQTSFPGGAVEVGESHQEAAVRETHEELGISLESIEVIGELDYIVSSNRIIYCYVGILHEVDTENIAWNEEVEYIYTIPVDFLLRNEPTYYSVESHQLLKDELPIGLVEQDDHRVRFGRHQSKVPFYDLRALENCSNEILWGYTANMTHRFTEVLISGSWGL